MSVMSLNSLCLYIKLFSFNLFDNVSKSSWEKERELTGYMNTCCMFQLETLAIEEREKKKINNIWEYFQKHKHSQNTHQTLVNSTVLRSER